MYIEGFEISILYSKILSIFPDLFCFS